MFFPKVYTSFYFDRALSLAAKVLTGQATCQELPYETIAEYGIYVNSAALEAMNITLPDAVAQKAIEASEG